jgi:hypothetical protein
MEDELKPKKKRAKKNDGEIATPKDFEALAKLTSSDVIRQVKAGLSRMPPMDEELEGEPTLPDDLPY